MYTSDGNLPAKRMLKASHPQHGSLEIMRGEIARGGWVRFTLQLTKHGGGSVTTNHSVLVQKTDLDHRGRSSIGYGVIDFDDALQGKGIGYLYHHALAMTGKELGVELLAVDNVIAERPLESICVNSGMRLANNSNYELEVAQCLKTTEANMKRRGWTISG